MLVPVWGVVMPYDRWASPAKPKFWVCVDPAHGLFMRINSAHTQGAVLLSAAEHPFLQHDSWLHCWGPPITVTDGELDDLMTRQRHTRRQGLLGEVARSARGQAVASINKSLTLPPARLRGIMAAVAGTY